MIITRVFLLKNKEGKYKEFGYVSFSETKDGGMKNIPPVRLKILDYLDHKWDEKGNLLNSPQKVEEFYDYFEDENPIISFLSSYEFYKII